MKGRFSNKGTSPKETKPKNKEKKTKEKKELKLVGKSKNKPKEEKPKNTKDKKNIFGLFPKKKPINKEVTLDDVSEKKEKKEPKKVYKSFEYLKTDIECTYIKEDLPIFTKRKLLAVDTKGSPGFINPVVKQLTHINNEIKSMIHTDLYDTDELLDETNSQAGFSTY